jgi:membrane-bound lytic murein transglycosylase B
MCAAPSAARLAGAADRQDQEWHVETPGAGRGARLAVAAVVAALGLAACSGGGDRPSAASQAPSATAPASSTSPAASAPAATSAGPATSAGGAASSSPAGNGPAPTAAAAPPTVSTAARLAATLTRTERAIRDPGTRSRELPALGRAQQRAYRAIARQPSLLPEVLPLVPAGLRAVVRANVTAGIDLRKLSRPGPRLPPWRIVAPPPAAELLAAYHDAEARLGVSWAYLAAINVVETRSGRIHGTSPAGAKGPMQFLPSTFRRYGAGGDIESPHDAILAAARMLRANGAPADMAGALFAYNHSRLYVRAVTAYAEQMRADQRAFLGYHQWQVYYGDTLLPEGYPALPAGG